MSDYRDVCISTTWSARDWTVSCGHMNIVRHRWLWVSLVADKGGKGRLSAINSLKRQEGKGGNVQKVMVNLSPLFR